MCTLAPAGPRAPDPTLPLAPVPDSHDQDEAEEKEGGDASSQKRSAREGFRVQSLVCTEVVSCPEPLSARGLKPPAAGHSGPQGFYLQPSSFYFLEILLLPRPRCQAF